MTDNHRLVPNDVWRIWWSIASVPGIRNMGQYIRYHPTPLAANWNSPIPYGHPIKPDEIKYSLPVIFTPIIRNNSSHTYRQIRLIDHGKVNGCKWHWYSACQHDSELNTFVSVQAQSGVAGIYLIMMAEWCSWSQNGAGFRTRFGESKVNI